MALNDAQIKNAKPAARDYKLFDNDGLYLQVTTAGGRSWRLKYYFAGKEKTLTLGRYPAISLVEARRKRNVAREAIDEGRDPAAEKAARKRAVAEAPVHLFKEVAKEWHATQVDRWTELYAHQVMKRFEDNVFPTLGGRPVGAIEPKEMLAALKEVEARGVVETTRRLRSACSSVFRYAVASGYCRFDPAAHLGDALKSSPKPVHYPTLKAREIGAFLMRLDHHNCELETKIAIGLTALTVIRTTELRFGDWTEFERLDEPNRAQWRVPPSRMKMNEEHLVPLSQQAVALILKLPSAKTREGKLFPSFGKDGVISNNTMLYALYDMGYKGRMTMHGFRSLFSTEANESGQFDSDWIERQLAHDERDDTRAAYNAAQYLRQRREMMQWWADHLDQLRKDEVARRSKMRQMEEVIEGLVDA
ncbi:MAG: DUF4102 domain-containing protein [Verrucomicrobiaceae bacterium]|nr:MAG: DUF4102 domain-containing protein [Verrucomicrobiaceae bacterium]